MAPRSHKAYEAMKHHVRNQIKERELTEALKDEGLLERPWWELVPVNRNFKRKKRADEPSQH